MNANAAHTTKQTTGGLLEISSVGIVFTHHERDQVRMHNAVFQRTPLLMAWATTANRNPSLLPGNFQMEIPKQLFEVLTCDEAYVKKPISLRHPLIFYLGHTATFFINKLLLAGLIRRHQSCVRVDVRHRRRQMSWDDLATRAATGPASPR